MKFVLIVYTANFTTFEQWLSMRVACFIIYPQGFLLGYKDFAYMYIILLHIMV